MPHPVRSGLHTLFKEKVAEDVLGFQLQLSTLKVRASTHSVSSPAKQVLKGGMG